MEEIRRLETRIDELDKMVRDLQVVLSSPRFVPLFTRRMSWAIFMALGILIGVALFAVFTIHRLASEVHFIYLLLN